MLFAILFVLWRLLQILTLIPTMGMLAYFVDIYTKANALTPNHILVLFIVSVLGLAWAIFTLFSYHRSSSNALFVAIVDLGFVGALIAAVWYLRFIRNADCASIRTGDAWDVSFGLLGSAHGPGVDVNVDKTCAMLKAAWVFAMLNCIFFFFTAILAFVHGDRESGNDRKVYVRETQYRHSAHRSPRTSRTSHRRVYV